VKVYPDNGERKKRESDKNCPMAQGKAVIGREKKHSIKETFG